MRCPPKKAVARILLLVLLVVLVDAFAVEPYWVEVTHVTLRQPAARPAARRLTKPLRIMHLSDLHGSDLGSRERKILAVQASEHPDLIVLTGDTSDRGSFAGYASFLKQLHAPLGVFAVQGNWEYWKPAPDQAAVFDEAKITTLTNRSLKIRDDITLVGFDDLSAGQPNVVRAFPPPAAEDVVLIGIMHEPQLVDSIPPSAPKLDLVLAGHSHGGQVRLPFIGPLWTPPGTGRYVAGSYEAGTTLYVSRGVGTSLLPVRFFCRPEIAILDFVPAEID